MGNIEHIEPLKIGIRCQDIQTSLQDFDMGPLGVETKNIRLLGMAERLAIHIRGSDVIDDYRKLEYVSSQFGIDPLILKETLRVLEDVGWIRVKSRGSNIIRVEETVPYFNDIYSEIGEYYENISHSEVEDAIIGVTDLLALSPLGELELKGKFGIDNSLFDTILDIGKTGMFIDKYELEDSGESVLYSPLYWVENPEKVEKIYEMLKKYGAENILNSLNTIRNYQGYPLPDSLFSKEQVNLTKKDEIFIELIKNGMLLTPRVNSHSGEKNFAFTPNVGVSIEEKVILEKAMAILSCIRYGEHFAMITKIKFPGVIIDRLLSSPYKIGSHTEIRRQYAILVSRGVGRIFPDSTNSKRWYFQLIDTKENLKAVRLAKDMLLVGESISQRGVVEELKKVFFYHGSYEEYQRVPPKLKKSPYVSEKTEEKIFSKIIDSLRGGQL